MTLQSGEAGGPATLLDDPPVPANGGFPEPLSGGPIRVVRTEHRACGRETRVRLPAELPTGVVRRVVCQGCAQAFEVPAVAEVEVLEPPPAPPDDEVTSFAPRGRMPGWLRDPGSRTWRFLSIPVAAIAVVAVLLALQGDDEPEVAFESSVPAADSPAEPVDAGGQSQGGSSPGPGSATHISESTFTLALPPGWQRSAASGGATFAAASAEGDAEVTLWVEENPDLAFSDFEAESLDELEALAGSARVVERLQAPTADATIVRLAADAPEGSPAYEVTLRTSGPYRYYLSTTVQPDASAEATEAAQLIHGSFVPAGALPSEEG